MAGDWWNTVDFRPAPPGWRVVFLWPQAREVLAVAGWLIQERYSQGSSDPYPLSKELDSEETILGRRRRVVPGVVSESYDYVVQAIDDNLGSTGDVWMVLPPGAPEPTVEAEQSERAKRAARGASD